MSSTSRNPNTIRRGLRFFSPSPNNDNIILIFVHGLASWNESRLWEFLSKKISNCNDIILGIVKKHFINMENYFIIRVNCVNEQDYLKVLYLISTYLPIKKIKWKFTSKIRTYSIVDRLRKTYCSEATIAISNDLLYSNPSSNGQFFNLCVSWNVNGWNSDKRDGLTYFNSIFQPICICLQEVGNSSFLNSYKIEYPFLDNYKTELRKADLKYPGMRGLYIGVHRSCKYITEPYKYKYILSISIMSFWGIKCSLGNTYIPCKKHKDSREKAKYDLKNWLHDHQNSPSIIVGDFNMTKQQLQSLVSSHSQNWLVMEMIGHQFTWANGGKTSCIDFIVVNDKMKEYLHIASVCTTFNDISGHFPLILSCKKTSADGFVTPSPKRTVKWSSRICRLKKEEIFSHNKFSILFNEFEHNSNLDSNSMVTKLLDSANEVGDDIQARVPKNLSGSAFHCPSYIKKLSHAKHVAYHKIKKFTIAPDASNIQEFLDLVKQYTDMGDYIKGIKKNIRDIRYKNRIHTTCDHFLSNDYKRGWEELKKISKPSFTPSQTPVYIKDKEGNPLISVDDQLNRFAEHYSDLASDFTEHSLNETYWRRVFSDSPPTATWDINQPISMSEIENTVLSMKNNKAPGPDGIPTEFFKAFFDSTNNTSDNENSDQDSPYSDCAKCLLLLFNRIWDGDFPDKWNSASIVSIPKKGDLSDCNNYRGISLINVGLKILSKIVTKRISDYAMSHGIIRPEQFGFRNKEECISLYVSIREICQRRHIKGNFTYLAFLDLKKAYDSVPIFNILTKLKNIGIRGKCLQFLTNLYRTSKARANLYGQLSDEFPIHRGVRQGCPLSPILFNIFINDILDGCDKYGVLIDSSCGGPKRCCGGLFADDIVLIAPRPTNLRKLLSKVYEWSITNEMTFGISKCATLVVKPINFIKPRNYHEPTFYLGFNNVIPKTNEYTYLGIPFNENLKLDPIVTLMNTKTNLAMNSFFRFLTNRSIPYYFKTRILVSYVLSKVFYFAPLLGSNRDNTKKVQTILNRGMYWSFGFKSTSSNSTIYNMSKELFIPPIASFCANAMIRCFNKWKYSSCIIADLVNNIPTLSHFSWTKKARRLTESVFSDKHRNEVRKIYWENDFFIHKPAIRSTNYKKYKFGFKKLIHRLTLKYPQFSLGFFWIGRIKCGFNFDVKMYIKSKKVLNDCPRYCPCCKASNSIPSFTHWVLSCPKFNDYREQHIPFVHELFIDFHNISSDKSLNLSVDSEKDFEDNLSFLVLCVLLGGNTVLETLTISGGERRALINKIFQTSSGGSSLPYFTGLAEFLTNVMPVVTSDFFGLIDRYTIRPTVVKSVDVVTIRQRINSDTESTDNTNSRGVIIEEWEELEGLLPYLTQT